MYSVRGSSVSEASIGGAAAGSTERSRDQTLPAGGLRSLLRSRDVETEGAGLSSSMRACKTIKLLCGRDVV